ncbi:MAG: cell division ATP-binding protein FtsE [Clostridiales bacterium]|nr:cell division ATP-binding protein FtsE [Clostridiales bacterium]
MIHLKNVSKSYDQGVQALSNISIDIEKGEFVFLVGHSGAGKSTLFKMLLKEVEPTSGEIYVNGQNLRKLPKRKIPKYRRKIGVVFQDFRLLEDYNVYENIALAQRVAGASAKEIRINVPVTLARLGLEQRQKSYPRQLSGGEQQRVAIARALVNEPEILLADEPTGNIDSENAKSIMLLLERINREMGTTIVVVTHDRELVERMGKRVIIMKNGEIISDRKEENSEA